MRRLIHVFVVVVDDAVHFADFLTDAAARSVLPFLCCIDGLVVKPLLCRSVLTVSAPDFVTLLSTDLLTRQVEEQGLSYPGNERDTGSIEKVGSFHFIAPNGQDFHVDYNAGVQGFVATGAHLPQPPPQLKEYEEHRQQYPELYRLSDQQYDQEYDRQFS